MRPPLARMIRRSVKAGQNLVSQIVVSVAAATCVAFITSAYLTDDTGTRPEPAHVEAAALATAAPAPTTIAAPQSLPPLETETIAEVPVGGTPANAEIFPGVAAEGTLAQTAKSDAAPVERKRRHFLGLPLPFLSADASASQGEAAIETFTR